MADPRWIDPEIDALFGGDAELAELVHRVRAARPEPPLDPRFQSVLRAQLMREAAARDVAPARAPRLRSSRRWWHLPASMAWPGAGIGVALVAAAALIILNTHVQDHSVTAMSPVAQLHAVSPDNVITVAFSQPMNEAAVVAGLHIRPATEVTTAWQGNNLVITPTHHLAGNTPYTVTIDHSAARSASGQLAPAAITISFGTAPTPPAAPAVVTVSPTALGAADSTSQLVAGPGGSVIATSAPPPSTVPPAPATSTPAPSPASAAQPKVLLTPPPYTSFASPSPSSPSPSAASTPVPSPAGGGSSEVAFARDGSVTVLGPAVTGAAVSPNGLQLLSAVPAGVNATIVLSSISGAQPTVLTTISTPILAIGWLDAETALVAEPDHVVSVDLQGHMNTLAGLPAGTSSAVFAPKGGLVFAGANGQDGQLLDVSTGHGRPLPGSRAAAAFSGDGDTVAWLDTTGADAKLVASPVAREAAAMIPLGHPGDTLSGVALDQSGSRVAIVDQSATGSELDVESLPSGTVIARGPAATRAVFLSNGDLAMVTAAGKVARASLPGTSTGSSVNVLPDGAAGALQAFVDAQTAANVGALTALSGPSVGAVSATPTGLTRSYVISAAANHDGTVAAIARLIVDASAAHPLASFADETLTLAPSTGGSAYQVTSLSVGALSDEPVGPHVLRVVPALAPGRLGLEVTFDSDLAAATVAPAIQVTSADGTILPVEVAYDPNTRTATLTVDAPAGAAVTVSVGTSLRDVDGQSLAQTFSTATGG